MKCPGCPVRPGLECLGERNHPPMCDHVRAGQPGRAEQLVAMAEGRRRDQGTVAAPRDARPAVRDEVRFSLLRNACPHARPASCGCADLKTCSLGKGKDGLVDRATCFACLREREAT